MVDEEEGRGGLGVGYRREKTRVAGSSSGEAQGLQKVETQLYRQHLRGQEKMENSTSRDEGSSLSFERIVFFSDAVFAIAITLLVLEIKPPHLDEASEAALIHGLVKLIPKFTGFLVSFLIVGAMWIEHHRIFRYLKDFDTGLLWRNLVHLLTISFIPFPTALFSEYFWSRTAFITYTASFAAAGLTKFWVWRYATAKRDFAGFGGDLVVRRVSRRSLAVPLACCTAIGLSMFSVFAAPAGFALIPVYARLLDPTRKITRQQSLAAGESNTQ